MKLSELVAVLQRLNNVTREDPDVVVQLVQDEERGDQLDITSVRCSWDPQATTVEIFASS